MCLSVLSAPTFSHSNVTSSPARSQYELRCNLFHPLLLLSLPSPVPTPPYSTLLPHPVSALALLWLHCEWVSAHHLSKTRISLTKLISSSRARCVPAGVQERGIPVWAGDGPKGGSDEVGRSRTRTLHCRQLFDQLSPFLPSHPQWPFSALNLPDSFPALKISFLVILLQQWVFSGFDIQ